MNRLGNKAKCTPEQMLCDASEDIVTPDQLRTLNEQGVHCVGALAASSRRAFGCGARGAIMGESVRRSLFDNQHEPLSYEENWQFATEILSGETPPAEAFAELDARKGCPLNNPLLLYFQ